MRARQIFLLHGNARKNSIYYKYISMQPKSSIIFECLWIRTSLFWLISCYSADFIRFALWRTWFFFICSPQTVGNDWFLVPRNRCWNQRFGLSDLLDFVCLCVSWIELFNISRFQVLRCVKNHVCWREKIGKQPCFYTGLTGKKGSELKNKKWRKNPQFFQFIPSKPFVFLNLYFFIIRLDSIWFIQSVFDGAHIFNV